MHACQYVQMPSRRRWRPQGAAVSVLPTRAYSRPKLQNCSVCRGPVAVNGYMTKNGWGKAVVWALCGSGPQRCQGSVCGAEGARAMCDDCRAGVVGRLLRAGLTSQNMAACDPKLHNRSAAHAAPALSGPTTPLFDQ
jgi:hypothetical protein